MRYFLAVLLLSCSAPVFADNIAGCEVVLMERIEQEGLEGSAEVASFRPAEDFIASVYDEETEILRKIDGLTIRAIMCKRQSVIPSLRDFPIVATGTPFMISQNFDSTESGLTTVYFKDGEFRHSYKGPDLDVETEAELIDRIEVFNLQPHNLAEKETAMLEKVETEKDDAAIEDKIDAIDETEMADAAETDEPETDAVNEPQESSSTEETKPDDDLQPESADEDEAPKDGMEHLTPNKLTKEQVKEFE
jgi:hypothetical protein